MKIIRLGVVPRRIVFLQTHYVLGASLMDFFEEHPVNNKFGKK